MNAKCPIVLSLVVGVVGLASVCSIASSRSIDPQTATEAPALRIEEIAAECRHDNGLSYNLVNHSCIDRLTRHFKFQPVWKMSGMLYHWLADGGYSVLAINPRAGHLKFTRADNLLREVPTWFDIFDGRVHQRQAVVEGVFEDAACRALAKKGGIRPELAERCHARDLFKYATHLDACLMGMERDMLLMKAAHKSIKSIYEMSMDELVRRHARSGEARIRALIEFNLHASWIAGLCNQLPGMAFNDDLQLVPMNELLGDGALFDGLTEFSRLMKKGHDAALGIAARSGDAWAIQSYEPPRPLQDPDYWNTLRDANPLLLHRWMASPLGRSVLSEEERLWHAVKAYSIERELVEDLSLKGYVEQYDIREADIRDATLKRALSGEDGPAENGAQSSVDDMAVSRIADGRLLKYPWQAPSSL